MQIPEQLIVKMGNPSDLKAMILERVLRSYWDSPMPKIPKDLLTMAL